MLFPLSFPEYGGQNKAPIAFGKAINAQDLVRLFSQHFAILTENGIKFHRFTTFLIYDFCQTAGKRHY